MNKRTLTLIVALLVSVATGFASSIISIPTDGTKSLIVDTKVWKTEFISISIYDIDGNFIFEDTYTTEKGKRFSVENLPKGKYTLTIENDLKTTTQGFEITNTEVVLDPKEDVIFKPLIKIENDFIDLNYLSKSNNASVKIYEENREVYSFDFENQMAINKRFDINKLPAGSYTLSVSSKYDTFSKSFQKK